MVVSPYGDDRAYDNQRVYFELASGMIHAYLHSEVSCGTELDFDRVF